MLTSLTAFYVSVCLISGGAFGVVAMVGPERDAVVACMWTAFLLAFLVLVWGIS